MYLFVVRFVGFVVDFVVVVSFGDGGNVRGLGRDDGENDVNGGERDIVY